MSTDGVHPTYDCVRAVRVCVEYRTAALSVRKSRLIVGDHAGNKRQL